MQLGTVYLTLMHKEKKIISVFVVQGGSPAVLGMPEIETLGVLTINYDTIGRQAASDDNANNWKRNCQCVSAVQTEGGKFECHENKRQDTEEQSEHNTDNTAELSIVTNPQVIGNNSNGNSFFSEIINKDGDSFLSELTINENQSFVSDQLRKDDTVASNTKQTSETH